MRRLIKMVLVLSGLTVLTAQAEDDQDPLESYNRAVFEFNETLDEYVARPLALGYQYVTPQPVDDSVTNFFSNLGDVLVIGNDLLQFKFLQALSDTGRFLVNSTVGFFGFFDVASHIGLEKHNEDFGQTLGYWGVDSGPYLMLPLLGPTTVRDGLGLAVDSYSGLSYTEIGENFDQKAGLFLLNNIDLRADLMASEGLISGDRYIFIRSFYLQRRDYLINDGVVEDEFDEDFDEDFEDEEDWESEEDF